MYGIITKKEGLVMKQIEIYWKDLTKEKQQEIIALLGDNMKL